MTARRTLLAADVMRIRVLPDAESQDGHVLATKEELASVCLCHYRTTLTRRASSTPARPRLSEGRTVWFGTLGAAKLVVVAFEWAEVRPGVLTISDVLGMKSNLQVRANGDGGVLAMARATLLLSLLRSTNWQAKVLEHIPRRART